MPVANYAYICENIIIKYNDNLLSLSKFPLIEQGNTKISKYNLSEENIMDIATSP